MKMTALSIKILINVVFLLSTLPGQSCFLQKPDFPSIFPNRLQFFEYDPVFISCGENKDMNAWKVIRKLFIMSPTNVSDDCNIPAPSCTIDLSFESHSGEYWCENDEGERSRALNISFTAGSVILDFGAQPVNEGSNVILRCVHKNNEQTQITDFFKDGMQLITKYENVLSLENISKSDEGLYKCSISGAGDSAESWLTVVRPEKGPNIGAQPVQYLAPVISFLLCTLVSLILLVVGLIFFKKRKALRDETVTGLNEVTYAVVNKPRKRNGGNAENEQNQVTYASIGNIRSGQDVCTATIGQYTSKQETTYSEIRLFNH
ncbi:uncharacterized protein LOC119796070 [Cyprinodon tularosa]|uniref:uncharacterized protein LOC119796070 n=1 Tax=Cyprinodon tularosa TaxID=77115 RepID=UPI0018E24846|nr:uncharacterized protein LOC119796070 [Cyprinodon tularosa]